jgi:hypothetical protein
MKRLITSINRAYLSIVTLFMFLVGLNIQQIQAQCIAGSQFGTSTVTNDGNVMTATTCAFAGEYSVFNINNVGLINFVVNNGAYMYLNNERKCCYYSWLFSDAGIYFYDGTISPSCAYWSRVRYSISVATQLLLNGLVLALMPTDLSASNITFTSADAEWLASGTETTWDIYYGLATITNS